MKPLPIADYLDHLGRAPNEKASPRREGSPFRPRTLSSLQNREPPSIPVFDRKAEAPHGIESQFHLIPRRSNCRRGMRRSRSWRWP
jgi:hypothetical protein